MQAKQLHLALNHLTERSARSPNLPYKSDDAGTWRAWRQCRLACDLLQQPGAGAAVLRRMSLQDALHGLGPTEGLEGLKEGELERSLSEKAPTTIVRESCDSYENTSARFTIPKRTYSQQYSQIYFCRLRQLKSTLRDRSAAAWGERYPHVRVLDGIKDLSEKTAEECVLIGVLYKDMKLRPSALDEYMKELEVQQCKDS